MNKETWIMLGIALIVSLVVAILIRNRRSNYDYPYVIHSVLQKGNVKDVIVVDRKSNRVLGGDGKFYIS